MEGRTSSKDSNPLGINKQSVAKTKERKNRYPSDVEMKTLLLQTQVDTLSLQLTLMKGTEHEMSAENSKLKQQVSFLMKKTQMQDARHEASRKEIEYLRAVAGHGIPPNYAVFNPHYNPYPGNYNNNSNVAAAPNAVFVAQPQPIQAPQQQMPRAPQAPVNAHVQNPVQAPVHEGAPSASSTTEEKTASEAKNAV